MSRDFKNEYETYLENEIPDLWSRIEPRLADKPAAKKRKKRNLTFYYGIAAAGLLLAISVPVALRFASGSQRMDNSFSGGAQDFVADVEFGGDTADSMMNSQSGSGMLQEAEAAAPEAWWGDSTESSMENSVEDAGMAVEDSFLNDSDIQYNGITGESEYTPENAETANNDGGTQNDRSEGAQSEKLLEITGVVQEIRQYRDRIIYLIVVSEASEEAGLSVDDEVEIIQYLSDREPPAMLPEDQTVRLSVLKNSAGTYELVEIDSSRF